MTAERISALRAVAGFAAGTAFVLAVYSWLLWSAWFPVLVVGGGTALVVLGIFGVPAFLLLRKRGMLSVYAAAILGGIFCTIPPALLAFSNWNGGFAGQELGSGEVLFWLQYFALPGVIGGLFGWLVAAGWRIRAA
jgi:hypothetical protein